MTKIYACLLGEWVNLCDDEHCKMGEHMQSPITWYKENAPIWAPNSKKQEHSYYQLDYIYISYKGKDYRINPIFIQIVFE